MFLSASLFPRLCLSFVVYIPAHEQYICIWQFFLNNSYCRIFVVVIVHKSIPWDREGGYTVSKRWSIFIQRALLMFAFSVYTAILIHTYPFVTASIYNPFLFHTCPFMSLSQMS